MEICLAESSTAAFLRWFHQRSHDSNSWEMIQQRPAYIEKYAISQLPLVQREAARKEYRHEENYLVDSIVAGNASWKR